MVHDLPNRLFHHRHGRTVFGVIVVLFVLTQLGLAIRRVLPEPYQAPLPWRMFHKASPYNQFMELSGVTEDGTVVPIDGTRWFAFRSGNSTHPYYVRSPPLWGSGPNKQRQQRVFGRWLAHKVWTEDGIRLQEVRITKDRMHLRTGTAKKQRVTRIPIEPIDLERSIPREAKAVPL